MSPPGGGGRYRTVTTACEAVRGPRPPHHSQARGGPRDGAWNDGGRCGVRAGADADFDAFKLFTDVEPDADRMLAHFTALVTAPRTDVRVG